MEQTKLRSEIDDKYKWDLKKIYPSVSDVDKDIAKVYEMLDDFEKKKGNVLASSKNLLDALKLDFSISRTLEKIVVYANMLYHEDMGLSSSLSLVGRIDKIVDEVSARVAFFIPELLDSDYSLIEKYLKEEKDLETYRFVLEDIFRDKKHILSIKEEELLASSGEIFSSASNIYESLDDVDLKFGIIKDEENKKIELNNSNYLKYIKSSDRRVRRDAFNTYYKAYFEHKNTFASCLKASVNADNFIAQIRNYDSALDMALDSNNIDVSLYEKLINTVNNNLDILHKYMKLRKKILNLDELHMYDLYNPLVKGIDKTYSYDEAKSLVLKALSPLGTTYINDLNNLFNSNCVDVYNNKNKHGGAYSWGCYDSLPYVLLNYEGTYNDVSTIAHEMGHSMHSFYSKKNQEYHNSSYTIFLAEIASTVNEIFLNKYLASNSKTKEEKLFFLNNLLEIFRTTLYRQTMFAEFERIIHDDSKNKITLTADYLSDTYLALNKKYYGEDVYSDVNISYEWMRISHFYTSYYVYKYATGISIACRIVSDILENKDGAKDKYLEFLSSGGSDYSLNILKKVGIDIVNDDTIDKAILMFKETLEEVEKVLES